MTLWCHASDRRAPSARANVSVAPPGDVGTTIFTGLAGQFCADAEAQASTASHSSHRLTRENPVMVHILLVQANILIQRKCRPRMHTSEGSPTVCPVPTARSQD